MAPNTDFEKRPSYTEEEKIDIVDAVLNDPDEKGDYSGAVAKTDEAEIRLVRKLDLRIMPTLWAMYFLWVLFRASSF